MEIIEKLFRQTIDDEENEESEENQIAEHVLSARFAHNAQTTHCGLEEAFGRVEIVVHVVEKAILLSDIISNGDCYSLQRCNF